jgi:hypothetical protein
MRQTSHTVHRTKVLGRRKHLNSSLPSAIPMSTKLLGIDQHSHHLSTNDSILSRISFDTNSDILTVSRMGSIFYCLEDFYSKVFSTLCKFDEFTGFILKPAILSVKQVTLSEKIAIEQENTLLKKLYDLRYRLVSINSSDYFLKLKQLLHTHTNHGEINECMSLVSKVSFVILYC